ncbi:MAG: aminotransferase class III-fold pyridoxal phosphate-dependent enzyme [Rhizobiaceae bacterium]|nr:aminotransferase class III-fold pyridoxal phosphate-dependent enzyme [Rhizobiaceae bacterium]
MTLEILAMNRFDPARTAKVDGVTQGLLDRRAQTFGPASVLFYERPIHMVSAHGVFMQAADGTRYLDVYNNVPSVGHCHPKVVEAMARQAAVLNIHTRYLYDNVHAYAERLLATLPETLAHLMLTCTGTESNDLALRLAANWTGAEGFVVTETAYHGNSSAVTAISPSSMPGRALPAHVRAIPAPDAYRRPTNDVGADFAADLDRAIHELKASGAGFAGFVADSIFSSDGIYADPPGFLKAAIEVVQRHGGLFIADEVQPGFGRTGDGFWGFERHGVVPDIVTMGKPMGNGYPMGGVAVRADILQSFCDSVGYFNTFGGSPVAAAAGLAVLDAIEEDGLIGNAKDVGTYLMMRLRDLARRRPAIGDVRGAGLFVGLEFVSDPVAKTPDAALASRAINGLRDRRILIGAAGPYGNTLKIRPPLPFARYNADFFVEALDDVLSGEPA